MYLVFELVADSRIAGCLRTINQRVGKMGPP